MAKQNQTAPFWGELFKTGFYKRNQGRLARQLTAVAVMVIVLFGAYTLSQGPLGGYQQPVRIGVPLGLSLLGAWFAFRLVNYPRFADFLISVEAEIDKVSWASWPELRRATIVVLSTMLLLGVVLFGYDMFWVWFFRMIGVLAAPETPVGIEEAPPL